MANFKGNVPAVAEELDIDKDLLYRWKREQEKYAHNSFPGKGKPKLTDEEREIARLKRELADAREESEILKKAISIFSVRNGKSTSL